MVDSAARTAAWSWIVDAGRCAREGHSGRATGPFSGCRSCAASRDQVVLGVVESTIYTGSGPAGLTVRSAKFELMSATLGSRSSVSNISRS